MYRNNFLEAVKLCNRLQVEKEKLIQLLNRAIDCCDPEYYTVRKGIEEDYKKLLQGDIE